MSSVVVEHVSKLYKLYTRPLDRLKDLLLPGPRRYREFHALSDVSFQLQRGDALGIIGPNGAGKSTLLKILSGIVRPTAGCCQLEGRVTALLELGTGFHPEFTGRENIFLSSELLGIPRQEMLERLDSIIEFAEIGAFIDAPIRTYSSGMYVRLAFAVASMVDPDVLIVDEALAVGDMYFQKKSVDRIKWFVEQGKTALFVSHSMELIRRFCNRAVWLDEGRVRCLGDVPTVIAAYEHFIQKKEEIKLKRRREIQSRQIQSERADPSQPDGGSFKVLKKSWGTGEVKITNVEMIGADQKAKWLFELGESVTLRIHYHAFQPVPRPIFGVNITRLDGVYVYGGSNYHIDPVEYPTLEGQGYVEMKIANLLLHNGVYFLSVGVFLQPDEPFWANPADWHNQAYEFHVWSGMPQHGVIHLPVQWLPGRRGESDSAAGVPETVDLADDECLRFLSTGWWDRESDGDTRYCWSMAEAEILLYVAQDAQRLSLRGRVPRVAGSPVDVSLWEGDALWGTFRFEDADWHDVPLQLPQTARRGIRRLRFQVGEVFYPFKDGGGDTRELGFALSRIGRDAP